MGNFTVLIFFVFVIFLHNNSNKSTPNLWMVPYPLKYLIGKKVGMYICQRVSRYLRCVCVWCMQLHAVTLEQAKSEHLRSDKKLINNKK